MSDLNDLDEINLCPDHTDTVSARSIRHGRKMAAEKLNGKPLWKRQLIGSSSRRRKITLAQS